MQCSLKIYSLISASLHSPKSLIFTMATNPEVLEHTIYTTNLEDETGDGEAPSSNFKSVLDVWLTTGFMGP